MKWKCEDCSPRILDILEGALSREEQRAFKAHAAECERCRTNLLEHEEAWKLLDLYPEMEPSPGFVASTMAALERRKRTHRSKMIRRIAVAAAGLILAGSLYFHFHVAADPKDEGPEDQAQVETELLENLDLIEDLDLLEEFGEDLELAMEFELLDILNEGENL